MLVESVKIGKVKANPDNPRCIKDDKFAKLVKSIMEFPQMLMLRPIVVNDEMVCLGGNMRLKACKEAGMKEVPIIRASDLTTEQQKRFIITDNSNFGEYNFDLLANEWSDLPLADWGLDIPQFPDYSDKNKEIDTDEFSDKMTIKLEFEADEFYLVKEKLAEIAATPEEAILQLIK